MEKKDMVIASLEFAKAISLTGKPVTFESLYSHLVEKDLVSQKGDERHFIQSIHAKIIAGSIGSNGYISLDAYLGLLDYEDLQLARRDSQEARKEAKTALNYAKWSLLLATAVGIAQIIVSILT